MGTIRQYLLFLLLFVPFWADGNNVRVVGVVRAPADLLSGGVATIQLTLEWENSWRDDYNHDAIYLSLRYKVLSESTVEWRPVYLQDGGHSATNGYVYTLSPGSVSGRNAGIFIYAGSARTGTARTAVSLKWDYGTTTDLEAFQFASSDVVIACTGIEMVYIPRGAYSLGDYANTQDSSQWNFRQRDFYIPDSLNLVSTQYVIMSPESVASNPPHLAANRINDISGVGSDGSITNAWIANSTEATLLWTIDFGRLIGPSGDTTELPPASSIRRVEYISLESLPGYAPAEWSFWGNRDNPLTGSSPWEELYRGTSSDWNTSLERVYPGQKLVRLPAPRNFRAYRIIVNRDQMPAGRSPVLKTVAMADTALSRIFDHTFVVDTVVTRIGGVYGLFSNDGEVSWNTSSTLPSTYPNGYNAFYVMKYEMSQDQYRGFLGMLTPSQQQQRTLGASLDALDPLDNRYVFGSDPTQPNFRNGIVVSSRSDQGDTVAFACDLNRENGVAADGDGQALACNYLTPLDMLSYAAWVGLRPLSELEYERISRAPYPYVPSVRECAWGGVDAIPPSGLMDGGKINERFSTGNINFNKRLPGPSRVGIFALEGNSQSASGSSFWGVHDLSGNLSELYYNVSSTGRTFNATRHGNSVHESLSTLDVWGWDTTSSSFGLRGGNFLSTMDIELAVSDRRNAVRHIRKNDFRDSTVSFRLGRSVPEGPKLSSILTLENGRTTSSGSVSDTVCDGSDYHIVGNSPPGTYALYFLWYRSENLGKTWDLVRGENGSDLFLEGLTNRGMRAGVLHEYWFKRKAIRDNSDGVSSVVKIVVANPSYTVSRLRDTIDGYGKGAGITVITRYPTQFEWRYLATGAVLPSTNSSTQSYYLPDRAHLSDGTGKPMHGKRTVMVTMRIADACERSEIIEVDVINTMDKDIMKVKDYGGYRGWGEGTYAPSCEGYRRPTGGYEYRGDIGSGIYRIDPDGRHGPLRPFDIECDMTTDGGGWSILRTNTPRTRRRGYEGGGHVIFSHLPYSAVGVVTTEAQIVGLRAVSTSGYQYVKKECLHCAMSSSLWYTYGSGGSISYTNWPNYANCSPNDQVWREASGNITNVNYIPVRQFTGDDTGDSVEDAYYTFGDVYFR